MISDNILEVLFTIGICISFFGLIFGVILDRKNIWHELIKSKFNASAMIILSIALLIFIAVEVYTVKPTQQLFFDDDIYQAMALSLIHTGRAWMCNYGNANACYVGGVFHEPIGLSFNIAIAYLIFGVNRTASYVAQMAITSIAVIFAFLSSLLLFGKKSTAYFSALLIGISPIVLVWAMPTNSDMAVLAYSLISFFFLIIFIRKRSVLSMFNLLLSIALLSYMKIDALIVVPIFLVAYILLSDSISIYGVIIRDLKLLYNNILNTRFLFALLIFVIAIYPSIAYASYESINGTYGYSGTNIQKSCATGSYSYITSSGKINVQNFDANICANLYFWLNKFASSDVVQPISYTIAAIIGIALMTATRRFRIALVLLIWFFAIFLLYTAFYAGAVTYGVDWRFMLALMAPFAIFAAFTLGWAVDLISDVLHRVFKLKKHAIAFVPAALCMIFTILLLYQTYLLFPILSIKPSSIAQAGDARFYENFVYASANSIPNSCIVYSYDPTLYILNNKTSAQMSYLYNSSFYSAAAQEHPCAVLDIGYWCATPGNICGAFENYSDLSPINTTTYNSTGFTYGVYKIDNLSKV